MTAFAAQRFAIDVTQLAANGRLFDGPPDQVSSFPSYGALVLSTASSVVESVRDDQPDQIPFQPTPVTSATTALGNNVPRPTRLTSLRRSRSNLRCAATTIVLSR